jgi:3-mercaptopyruvate sulfurtransferase SseA
MNTVDRIDREELKTKLDRGEGIKLVMAMPEWAYNKTHIPGSLHFNSIKEMLRSFRADEEIVLYCTGNPCPASLRTYWRLKQAGYARVRHYAGGLMDWEQAGYNLEGVAVH